MRDGTVAARDRCREPDYRALDYAKRGLVIRPLALDVPFSCILVLPPGVPLSGMAREFLAIMRAQLEDDQKEVRTHLGRTLTK